MLLLLGIILEQFLAMVTDILDNFISTHYCKFATSTTSKKNNIKRLRPQTTAAKHFTITTQPSRAQRPNKHFTPQSLKQTYFSNMSKIELCSVQQSRKFREQMVHLGEQLTKHLIFAWSKNVGYMYLTIHSLLSSNF